MGLEHETDWKAMESIFVLNGVLLVEYGDEQTVLSNGDNLSAFPVIEDILITAVEDSDFLYISSVEVFDEYSDNTRELQRLVTEIEKKDGYTASHCERIRRHSLLIGHQMGLSTSDLFSLSCGALFHDIGKISIPDEILLKKGRLTPEEFDIIKQHTIVGRDMLNASHHTPLRRASVIAEQHHERYDGSGYPHGLVGSEINTPAAIVAVVDSYDAMTSDRPYQKAKTKVEVIKEIASLAGTLYDPEVVDAFLEVVEEFDP